MPEDTRERILDAALDTLTLYGINRLTLADVAKRANLSRQTLYRYFSTRDDLIAAAVLREQEALTVLVGESTAGVDDLGQALERALTTVVRAASQHPLLQRLIEVEPEGLLPFLISDEAPVLSAARPAFARLIVERSDLDHTDADVLAESLTRILISWAVNPPVGDIEVHTRTFARLITGSWLTRPVADGGR